MTPLLGTKTSSKPVGDKSGGDRRAARSLLSCALWRGMARLWRGMGGMGRPEPLSAHPPHQQQGLSGFHETRNTAFFAVGAQGTHNQKPPPGPPRTPPGRCFPARCGAAWGGYGVAWAAAVPRTGTRPVSLSRITKHETRNTALSAFPTNSRDFPPFPAISRPPHPPMSACRSRSWSASQQAPFAATAAALWAAFTAANATGTHVQKAERSGLR